MMNELDKTYKDFSDLTYEEFYDIFWVNVPEKTVSTLYLDRNEDFVSALTFDLYYVFQKTPGLTIKTVANFGQIFFFNLFRFKPMTDNLEELPDNY